VNIEITQQYIIYTAQTRLLDLGVQIAQSRSLTKPDVLEKRQRATKIRLWLKALNDDYASRDTREKIWYALMDIGNLNDVPFAPVLTTNEPPSILVGIVGPKGDTGTTGATGGGMAFSAFSVSSDAVVDSFDTSLSSSAEWAYEVFDSSNKRVERLTGGWLSGITVDDGGLATTDIGDTSGITFGTNMSGSTIQLIAFVTSGSWTVRGTRQLIPVSGSGIVQPTSLPNGKIWIGDSSNNPVAQTFTGDITVSNAGVTAISAGVIVNADIAALAAIAVNKLAALTISKAVVSDASGFLTTSTTPAANINYLTNVTSDIQNQINTTNTFISTVNNSLTTLTSTVNTFQTIVYGLPGAGTFGGGF